MTTSLEPAEKDFGKMMGFIMGYFQTQIAGAIANYSIADHRAKGPATADEIAKWEGIRERTLDEYRRLIEKAGFHFTKVKPIRSPMVVIEAMA